MLAFEFCVVFTHIASRNVLRYTDVIPKLLAGLPQCGDQL